jgi:hypothetical protein
MMSKRFGKCPEVFGAREPSILNETMTILHKLLTESESFLGVILAVPVCLTYSPTKIQEILQTYDDTYGLSQEMFAKLLKKSPELFDLRFDDDEESSNLWNAYVLLLINSFETLENLPNWNHYLELSEKECKTLGLTPVSEGTLKKINQMEFTEHSDVESILKLQWLPLFRNHLDSTIIKKLKILAAAVNGFPSLVARVYFSIREWNENNYLTESNYEEFIHFIMARIKSLLRVNYALNAENLSPDILYPAVFQYPLQINEANSAFINENIRSSVYINKLDSFSDLKELIPETSFLRILGAINPEDPTIKFRSSNENFKILLSLLTGFESILKGSKLEEIENSLEEMFSNLLRLKFSCLFTANHPSLGERTISLTDFFYGKIEGPSKELLSTKILISTEYRTIRAQRFTSLLWEDKFMMDLLELYRPEEYVQIISSAPYEKCFDHLIILKTNDLPILIFVESEVVSAKFKDGYQMSNVHTHFLNLLTFRVSREKFYVGKIFDAIREKNFIYMYTNSYPSRSMVIDENCVVLGQDILANFLRFIWPVYQTTKTEFHKELPPSSFSW